MIGQPSSLKVPTGAGWWKQHWRVSAVCLVLAAITFAVFGQTAGFGFVDFDDNVYIYKNAKVAGGLSLKGLAWVFTHADCSLYHPLTMLSLMGDYQLYGLHAGGYHFTNVALHTASAILLFLVLRQMTGALWRSAFVAAVFAIHPLRVESVAWVAERKDVLSGFFFMLALGAYARYVRKPDSLARYLMVAATFVLALLCKPTVVTLPLVLLLLDWWPLHRVKLEGAGNGTVGAAGLVAPFWGLVKEKIPLFLLAAGSCVMTVLVPGKVSEYYRLPFLERIGNAVVSYGIYLRQMVFPAGLAIPYLNPPNGLPFWEVALAFVLLAAISTIVLTSRKGRPYLLVGWLWYLGMLVPTIGIIQASYSAHADRYTYLPQIGIYVALTWLAAEWGAKRHMGRMAIGGLMTTVLGVLIVCAWKQSGYWKNSETLWIHTLGCTTGNYMAHYNLGVHLAEEGRVDEAIAQYQKALQINPDHAETQNNLGNVFFGEGRTDEAIAQYQKALQINPDHAEARNNLGSIFFQQGRTDEAISQFQKALQIKPDYEVAQYNLATALMQKGRVNEAISHFQKALQINPDNADAHCNLATALRQAGRVDEAKVHYQTALQIKPDFAEALYKLGNDLRQKGKVDEAIAQYQEALQMNPDYAVAQINLGTALFQTGRLDEAISHLQKALQINPGYAKAHNNLGNAFLQKGNLSEAIAHFQQAMQLEPDDPWPKNNLAEILATCPEASLRNGAKAVELARQANELAGGNNPIILATFAAAFAEAGRFPEAVETAQRALRLAEAQSNTRLAAQLQSEMRLYQAGSPFHGPAQTH